MRVLPADAVAPGVKVSDQRPWPGHKGRDHSISDQGLKGRWPGLRVPPPAHAFGDLKPQGPVKLPVPLLALAESPQYGLLGTRVWTLLQGGKACRAGTVPLGPGHPGAPSALRGSDLDRHRAPDPPWVAGTPEPPLHVILPGAGEIRPQDCLRRWLGRKAPPRLGDHPPRLGGVPVGRHPREGSGADAVPTVLGLGRPGPRVRVPLGKRLRRGLGCAQVAAHGSGRPGGGLLVGILLPEVPNVAGRSCGRSAWGSDDRWHLSARKARGPGRWNPPHTRAREAGRGDAGKVCRSSCSLHAHGYLKVTASSLCSSRC